MRNLHSSGLAGHVWTVDAAALVLHLYLQGKILWRDLTPGKNKRIVSLCSMV